MYKNPEIEQDITSYHYTPESEFEEEEEGEEEVMGKALEQVALGENEVIPLDTESVVMNDDSISGPEQAVANNATIPNNAANASNANNSANSTNASNANNATDATDAQPSNNTLPQPPAGAAAKPQLGTVEGFQLVQATGLTDTSTPTPKGSSIPSFATATPILDIPLPATATAASQKNSLPMPGPGPAQDDYNPLADESKSKQFTARTDYMIAEFFSRQVARLTRGAPEALDRSYRIFQQRFKERLGAQWAHITSQPEVEEAIKRVQDMYDYFESLEKIVRKQQTAIEKVNDAEIELALWYRKEGVTEAAGSIRDNMIHLANSYQEICRERGLLIAAYEQYVQFLHTFKKKAVADALETMKRQHAARLELDAYGSKLGQLEEKKLKTFARTPGPSESAALEKELTGVRTKFQDAKGKYQNLSTSLIDKAGLLDLKKGVDFAAHIQKIRQVHDAFNRGRTGENGGGVPEEDAVGAIDEHGLPVVN